MTYYARPRSGYGGPAYGLEYLGSIRRYPFSYYPTYSARPRYAQHGHFGRLGGPPPFTNAQIFGLRPRQCYDRPVRVGMMRGRYHYYGGGYEGESESSDSSNDDDYRPRGRGHGHRGSGHGHHHHHHHHHGHGGGRADEWLEDPRDDYGANILGRRPQGYY